MILVIFVLLIHCVQNEITDFSIRNQSAEPVEKKNIQDLTNKSVGYLPIAEILKRVNLTHISNESRFHPDVPEKSTTKHEAIVPPIQYNAIKVLLTGSDDELLQIPFNIIMANLNIIDTVMLSQSRKAIIWDLITSNVPVEVMKPNFLSKINGLWHDMPENELVKLNIKRWDVINFFGSSKFLKRRQAALLAYVIKKKYGPVLESAKYINKLKGLICGFPESDLGSISSTVFKNVEQVVFQNIWPCTVEQVKVLLNNAKRPDTYGPLEVWTRKIFERLGLLVIAINPYEFRKFNPEVFQGLDMIILDLMSEEQLAQFTEEQVANLNENAMMSYNLRLSNYKLTQENAGNGLKTINARVFLCSVIGLVRAFVF